MYGSNYCMKNKIIIFMVICLWSCVSNIQKSSESTIFIQNFVAEYNQLDSTYFLQVELYDYHENIESVWVVIQNGNTIDTTFFLNDSAYSGDQIMMNNIYSGIFYLPSPFMEYKLNVFITDNNGEILHSSEKSIFIEEQFLPEVIGDVIFVKSYEDGSGYQFDSSSPYFVNENTSYLNFQITIKDLNGIENIKSIRYKTETLWFSAVGECGCEEGKTCNNSSPTFYLTNMLSTSNDSIFTFEAINDYIKEPGFPINPISVCNRLGMITFSFVVFDAYFGRQTFVEELLFLPCSEGDWNCEYDCEYCTSVCGECSE